MEAVIAKVKAPILGWDFFTKYRLDLVWGQWGDIFLRDKKAKIQKRLVHIASPHGSLPGLQAVRIHHEPILAAEAQEMAFNAQCVAALESESESTSPKVVHLSEYIEILAKYKDILKPNFKEATTKHGIEYAIKTTGTPCKAKTRPLLP